MTINYGTAKPTIHLYLNLPEVGTVSLWDTALWDTATWSASEQLVDVAQYVRSGSVNLGRNRPNERFQPNTASFVLSNPNAIFSSENIFSPYYQQIKMWTKIILTVDLQDFDAATPHTVETPIFTGYVKNWQETLVNRIDPVISITCVDALAYVAKYNGVAQTPQGASELTSARFSRIIANTSADIDTFTTGAINHMQSTTLAGVTSTLLDMMTDCEDGQLFTSRDGTLCFYGQGATYTLSTALFSDYDESTMWIWGDGAFDVNTFGFDDASDIDDDSTGYINYNYADLQTTFENEQFANVVKFARSGGSEQTSTNEASRSLYGDKQYSRSDLQNTSDAEVLGLAQRYSARFGGPSFRFDFATFHLHKEQKYWSLLYLLNIRSVVTFAYNQTYDFNTQYIVDGLQHSFDRNGTWDLKVVFRPVVDGVDTVI